MRKFFVIAPVLMLGVCKIAFGQCTPPGIEIQTPLCETPSGLKTSFPGCTSVRMAWKGNSELQYILRGVIRDSVSDKEFEIRVNKDSSDKSGNYAVTVGIAPGAAVNWSVQAECIISSAVLYSNKLPLQKGIAATCKAAMPAADKVTIVEQNIQVYPNPSTGYLNVRYAITAPGPIRLSVVDISGKTVFQKLEDRRSQTGNIQLNLQQLSPGSYILQSISGEYISETKFILLKN